MFWHAHLPVGKKNAYYVIVRGVKKVLSLDIFCYIYNFIHLKGSVHNNTNVQIINK